MKKLLLLLLFTCSSVLAGELCPKTDFDEVYLPVINDKTTFCYEQYVLVYDQRAKTPLFSAERLAPGEKFMKSRKNSYTADKKIPKGSRVELSDYKKSGYDRGHLAPEGDMTSEVSERESFLLSNMVPQRKQLNRGIWRSLELKLRKLSETEELIVITGPVYDKPISYIGDKVPVPDATYKWVYNLADGVEFGYVIPNVTKFNKLDTYQTTKAELEKKTGLDLK